MEKIIFFLILLISPVLNMVDVKTTKYSIHANKNVSPVFVSNLVEILSETRPKKCLSKCLLVNNCNVVSVNLDVTLNNCRLYSIANPNVSSVLVDSVLMKSNVYFRSASLVTTTTSTTTTAISTTNQVDYYGQSCTTTPDCVNSNPQLICLIGRCVCPPLK